MRKTSSYRDALLESLREPGEAREYLNAALEDSPESFLKALRNVAQAHQMTKVAKESGLQRETLYRSLSEHGNPTFDTLSSVLSVCGLTMIVKSKNRPQVSTGLNPQTITASPASKLFNIIVGVGSWMPFQHVQIDSGFSITKGEVA
ncbi:MAG: addiction module antidote protein [Acidobacteriaceae bacterium]